MANTQPGHCDGVTSCSRTGWRQQARKQLCRKGPGSVGEQGTQDSSVHLCSKGQPLAGAHPAGWRQGSSSLLSTHRTIWRAGSSLGSTAQGQWHTRATSVEAIKIGCSTHIRSWDCQVCSAWREGKGRSSYYLLSLMESHKDTQEKLKGNRHNMRNPDEMQGKTFTVSMVRQL